MIIILGILLLMVLLVIGVPVPFCFGGATLFLTLALGYDPSFLTPSGYSSITNVTLWCIPLFIIAGGIIRQGKIGDALVDFVEHFLGRFKSGLGIVTVFTCGIFGAISGSASATLSAVGSIMAPKLKDKGYPAGTTASLIASSSILGLLIPPSAQQVLYAWISNSSVLACFLATVVPGIILIILLSVVQHFLVRNVKEIKVSPRSNKGGGIKALGRKTVIAAPALMMPVIILGGIYGGIMTPMEAAAVAALYCVPVAIFVYKGMKLKDIAPTMVESGRSTGAVAVMLMSAIMLARILTYEKVPEQLVVLAQQVSTNKYVILLMVNLVLFIIGMLMEDGCGIMLTVPLLLPLVESIGVSPVHFAAIIGTNLGMGLITPPCAPILYFSSQVCEASISDMLKPTLMLITFAWLPTVFLTTYIPALSLALPRLILGIKF